MPVFGWRAFSTGFTESEHRKDTKELLSLYAFSKPFVNYFSHKQYQPALLQLSLRNGYIKLPF
jgi:hypothetical protein